jgi:hypothetical protein
MDPPGWQSPAEVPRELSLDLAASVQAGELQDPARRRAGTADDRPPAIRQEAAGACDQPRGGAIDEAHASQVEDELLITTVVVPAVASASAMTSSADGPATAPAARLDTS